MNTGIIIAIVLPMALSIVLLGVELLRRQRVAAFAEAARSAAEEENLRLRAECGRAHAAEVETRERAEAARAAADGEIRRLQAERTEARIAEAEVRAQLAALRERAEAEKSERAEAAEAMRAQFRNLAGDILGEQSRAFRETNREALDILLKPFKDNIVAFRERVEHIYSAENEQRGALKNELRNLMELNRRITAETANLTDALRGNSKVQGDWGEMILETILDNSNLIRGVHYETQHTLKDSEGNNLRPDVILRLPEQKRIVIDSKVSLTAFVNYTGAATEAERARHLAAHVASVRQHVAELSRKEYQRLLDSPDFVIMFVPNEPAFLAALQSDPSIWSDAYDKKVIVSSPTNLFALLKLVDDLWKRNAQNKNTADIVTYGTKLYDQLVAFTASLENVGLSLDKARDAYADAYKRLCTGNDNIVRSGERLRRLGLPVKRRQSARTLDAAGAEHELPEAETPCGGESCASGPAALRSAGGAGGVRPATDTGQGVTRSAGAVRKTGLLWNRKAELPACCGKRPASQGARCVCIRWSWRWPSTVVQGAFSAGSSTGGRNFGPGWGRCRSSFCWPWPSASSAAAGPGAGSTGCVGRRWCR